MTTLIDFNPSPLQPFQFLATLDGALYACTVPWNLHGQRYYFQIQDLSGNVIYYGPLIGSPSGYDISLPGLLFTSQLVYRVQNRQFEIIG